MSTNEFDRLLNEKFDQHEFAYNHAGWERLSRQLPKNAMRRTVPFPWWKVTGMAAALAITVSGVAWYYSTVEQPKTIITGNQSAQPKASTNVETIQKPEIAQPQNITSGNPPTIATISVPPKNKIQPASINTTTPTPVALEIAEHKNAVVSSPVATSTKQEETAKNDIAIVPAKHATPVNINYTNEDAFEPVKRPSGNTALSLTGGMNYGSMNTGYMAGINAKQRLSNKLFVEGDLALVNNKASQSFTAQQQQFAVASRAPIDYKDANLMYVQLNPTIGYQVVKNVSLGVGADVQQLVNNENTLVNVNDEVKTIPGTDIGLTGKTEISLSRRLKAGVLYREGINNFLNNSGEYFDRRYLQVQLKFTVIGK